MNLIDREYKYDDLGRVLDAHIEGSLKFLNERYVNDISHKDLFYETDDYNVWPMFGFVKVRIGIACQTGVIGLPLDYHPDDFLHWERLKPLRFNIHYYLQNFCCIPQFNQEI